MEQLDVGACLSSIGGMEHEQGGQGSLNISDVIEVIQTTDPEFADASYRMYSGGGTNMDDPRKHQAYVKIIEQPASKALRFRYECEGRSAGSIPGVNSTPENKTYPSIQIVGYKGRAVVVVSCVTKDPPYRPHPHNLVGKEGCKKGVCTVEITNESMAVTFSNLGIQCVKKKDIDEALKVREDIRVDPYRTGFSHRSQPTSIDLNAVRLCFQVFLEGNEKGKFTFQLPPVVSDPIYDKKAMSDLVICKLSDCCSSVAGGKEIILLCEKVTKEDVQVHFYEEQNGHVIWEGYGDFQPTHVHKQVAISFRAPRYKSLEVEKPVKVFIQLRRPSDGATSEPLPFEFLPLDSDPKRKKPKPMLTRFPERDKARYGIPSTNPEQKPLLRTVKREPIDSNVAQAYMFVGNTSPIYNMTTSPSPQPQMMKNTYTPSPSPHSGVRTPSPMDYVIPAAVPPQYMAGGAVSYGVARSSDVLNIPGQHLNMIGTNMMGGNLVNHMSPEGVQVTNNLSSVGNYLADMVNISHNPAMAGGMGTMNLRGNAMMHGLSSVSPGPSDLSSVPKLSAMGLSSPRVPASTPNNPSPGPAIGSLLVASNLPPGPRGGVPTPQGINNTSPVTGLGEGNFLDLDRQHFSLGQLDSSDLAQLDLFDSNLSENFSSNVTLSESAQQQQQHQQQQQKSPQENDGQENMTDSFTRLTTSTIQEICNLNNMYKGGGNGN